MLSFCQNNGAEIYSKISFFINPSWSPNWRPRTKTIPNPKVTRAWPTWKSLPKSTPYLVASTSRIVNWSKASTLLLNPWIMPLHGGQSLKNLRQKSLPNLVIFPDSFRLVLIKVKTNKKRNCIVVVECKRKSNGPARISTNAKVTL